ncbi:MAG: tripartite tricarboxylate transporter TctB family protein [Bacteroidota bacterium]
MRTNQDVLAGVLFLLIGLGAVAGARDYEMGTAMRMGPAYFPTVLGWILYAFGAFLLLRGIARGGGAAVTWGWRPLAFVTLALLAFGFVITRFGLIPALAAMFLACAGAGRELRILEVVVVAAVLSAFAVGVFVYALKLPFRLVAGF